MTLAAFSLAVLLGAFALEPQGMPQLSEPPEVAGDLRCMIVTAKVASELKPDERGLWETGLVYYWGRVDGRVPNLDFKARLLAELYEMTPQKFDDDRKRCGEELKSRAGAMKDISAALMEIGKGAQ